MLHNFPKFAGHVALMFLLSACVGHYDVAAFLPAISPRDNAMDRTHEENLKMPELDDKKTLDDRSGELILGLAVVGAVVGTVVLVPLLAADKL